MSEHPTEYGKALIEAVARGVCFSSCGGPRNPKCQSAEHCYDWRVGEGDARAALLAACAKLREPSEAMVEAGMKILYPHCIDVATEAAWRAMLSQLLTEIGR